MYRYRTKTCLTILVAAVLFALQAPARAWTANDATFTDVEVETENSEGTAGGFLSPQYPGMPKSQGTLTASASPSVYSHTYGTVTKILKRTYTKQAGNGSITLSVGVALYGTITISGNAYASGEGDMSRSGTLPEVSGTWDHSAWVNTDPPGSAALSFSFNRNVLDTTTVEMAMAAAAHATKGTPGGAYGYGSASVTLPNPP